MNRKTLLQLARRAGFLPVLERLRYLRERRLSSNDNKSFLQEQPDFVAPPLWWMHDMYSHTNYRRYVSTGREHAKDVLEILSRHKEVEALSLADFGCGLARVLRHFPPTLDRWGFDVNATAIRWCQSTLPGIQFRSHALLPPLPAEDERFDAIYALSVFTHLSEKVAATWMTEFRRCLKPGGILLLTVHGEEQTHSLLPKEKADFSNGSPVYKAKVQEGSRLFATYHPKEYLVKRLFSGFEILTPSEERFFQQAWTLQKPFN